MRPNPHLSPNTLILQVTPSNDLNNLGKHGVDFHRFNRGGRRLRLDHTTDQEVLFSSVVGKFAYMSERLPLQAKPAAEGLRCKYEPMKRLQLTV
jgi:hypothetical protein